MMTESTKVTENRELLVSAQSQGGLALLGAYTRLSGPGWLQSAITLGGGSLTGALFLGVLGGTNMLWLQLIAIVMGVIMLSAISYVTLSTGKRPFQAINESINPVLGCGWLLGTSAANMIWCMPQFSLSYDALDKNLTTGLGDSLYSKLATSAVLFLLALCLVLLNERRGMAAKVFDLFLKALVGLIVVCFLGVVIYLTLYEGLQWQTILAGFIPNLNQWNQPTGTVVELLEQAPAEFREFWSSQIVTQQRDVMIGAAATAVGINMTFLLPYSMLARGWDKPFRGLARFDLSTGMAVPYIIVTSCVVIAAAFSFHGKVDEAFLSRDPAVMSSSSMYTGARTVLVARLQTELGATAWEGLDEPRQVALIAELSEAEKRLAGTLVKRDAFQLSQSLAPLLGQSWSNLIFGVGVLGMGFSSIIILMLVNGYVFRELSPAKFEKPAYFLGCVVAGVSGGVWPLVWHGESQFWLAILTSTFGAMLLPIAYITFFFMMNSRELLGDEKPRGLSLLLWNVLMGLSVAGAVVAAGSAMSQKMADKVAGPTIIGIAIFFGLMVLVGFAAKPKGRVQSDSAVA